MENQPEDNKRPTFLTVICILSFVGLGMSILNNLSGIIFGAFSDSIYPLIQEAFEQAQSEISASDPEVLPLINGIFEAVLAVFDHLALLTGLSALIAIICLAGVIMMWNLKKTGFYLYTGGKVIQLFIPAMVLGWNFISAMAAMGTFIGGGLFIVLYGLNLKAMK